MIYRISTFLLLTMILNSCSSTKLEIERNDIYQLTWGGGDGSPELMISSLKERNVTEISNILKSYQITSKLKPSTFGQYLQGNPPHYIYVYSMFSGGYKMKYIIHKNNILKIDQNNEIMYFQFSSEDEFKLIQLVSEIQEKYVP